MSQMISSWPSSSQRHAVFAKRDESDGSSKWTWVLGTVVVGCLSGVTTFLLWSSTSKPTDPLTQAIQIKPTLKNKPLPGACLTLYSLSKVRNQEESPVIARGVVAQDGTCSPSMSSDLTGVPAGDYVATLSWCKVEIKDGETVAGPDLVPQKFRNQTTSPLRVTVKEGNNPLVTLPLATAKTRVRRASHEYE